MNILRYPSNIDTEGKDYVTFTPYEYRSNAGESRNGAAPQAEGADSVILYMPNSTPSVGNANDWGAIDFPGPLGSLQRDLGMGAVNTVQDATSVSGFVGSVTESLKSSFSNANLTGAGRQVALRMIPQRLLGGTPNQLLALSKGEIYNPNVELAYTAPRMRSFSFAFDMIPSNPEEASIINQIILNFKKYSAPENLDSHGVAGAV